MNLKHRLNNSTTSTIQIISNTQAIYSDEISTNIASLQIIEAPTREELWTKLKAQAIKDANTQTRFQPIINLITTTDYKIINLHTNKVLHSAPLNNIEPTTEDCPI